MQTRSTKLDPTLMYPPYTARKFKFVRAGFGMPDPRDLAARVRNRFSRAR